MPRLRAAFLGGLLATSLSLPGCGGGPSSPSPVEPAPLGFSPSVRVYLCAGTLRATKRLRIAEREIARLRLDEVQVRARSELRLAREAVDRHDRIVASTRQAAETADEVLRSSRNSLDRRGGPPRNTRV